MFVSLLAFISFAYLVSGVDWGTGNRIQSAFVTRNYDTIVAWGDPLRGGNVTFNNYETNIGVLNSTYRAFAGRMYSGRVVAWGDPEYGGDISLVEDALQTHVIDVAATGFAFAALKNDGSVVTWGSQEYGGDSQEVNGDLVEVQHIFANERAFAAVTTNSSVITWGSSLHGGNSSAAVYTSRVLHVYSSRWAFAALQVGGSVTSWGDVLVGEPLNHTATAHITGVVRICTTMHAFAGLTGDGGVVTWGNSDYGGDATNVSAALSSGVYNLYSNDYAFVAIKLNEQYQPFLVVWGDSRYGGSDIGYVQAILGESYGYELHISSTSRAFAVRTNSGQAIIWGDDENLANCAAIAPYLQDQVRTMYTTEKALAFFTYDNTVYTCGPAEYGGNVNAASIPSSYAYVIAATSRAFAIVVDGKIHAWGDENYGGNTTYGPDRPEFEYAYFNSLFGSEQYLQNSYHYELPSLAPVPYPTEAPVNEPTNAPVFGTGLFEASPTYKITNGFAFAIQNGYTGGIKTFGEAAYGGNSSGVDLASNVYLNVASRFAYAVIKYDLNVLGWGASGSLRDDVNPRQAESLVANEGAFAGTLGGQLFTFGAASSGGALDLESHCHDPNCENTVAQLIPSACAFAGISQYAQVFAWGNRNCGGDLSPEVAQAVVTAGGARRITATREAFAVQTLSGSVITWGSRHAGGDMDNATRAALQSGVEWVTASKSAFVAFKTDSSIVVWGNARYGGNASAVAHQLSSGVLYVAHTFAAMAALKSDGSVVTWGRADSGGDSTAVQPLLQNIGYVQGNSRAFVAVNNTGGVVTWGKAEYGGVIPPDKVADLSSGVVEIFHTDRAFAALKSTGQLVVWGQAGHGGSPGPAIEAMLLSNVVRVCSNDVAFLVIKTDGTVVAWGHPVSVPEPGEVYKYVGVPDVSALLCV